MYIFHIVEKPALYWEHGISDTAQLSCGWNCNGQDKIRISCTVKSEEKQRLTNTDNFGASPGNLGNLDHFPELFTLAERLIRNQYKSRVQSTVRETGLLYTNPLILTIDAKCSFVWLWTVSVDVCILESVDSDVRSLHRNCKLAHSPGEIWRNAIRRHSFLD